MNKLLTSIIFRCTNFTGKRITANQPYYNFLKSDLKTLHIVNSKIRSKSNAKIFVPHNTLARQEVKKFFQQNNLRQKNMVMDVDSSHLLGVKRLLILQHLKKNIYKGVQQPINELAQSNPEYESKIQDLFFDDDIFFMTDPKFVKLWQTNKSQDEIDEIIQNFYDNNIERGVERLREQFKLPQQFLYIIETAHNYDNKIYFSGINQYDIRNILWLYYTVDELKNMFVNAMHYWKSTQAFLNCQNTINMFDFNNKCREYIHQQNYHIFQPYRYNRLKLISSKISHSITVAHSYAFHKTGMDSMNLEYGKQHSKASESDKIQKHAILEVMLGNLWGQQYSNHKFPYLSENYLKLNESDKSIIDGIFNKHCNIYRKAIEKFRDKHFKQVEEKLKQKLRSQVIN